MEPGKWQIWRPVEIERPKPQGKEFQIEEIEKIQEIEKI
jgi:hypothetical protein